MNLQLVTLDGTKFKEDAYSIILPTMGGEITVLPGHEPLLTALTTGVITIRKNAADPDYHLEHYATYGGLAEVGHEGVKVLVDEATHGDEINEAEAQKARNEAQAMLASATTQVDIEHAQALIDRHATRLQVANLRRRHQKR